MFEFLIASSYIQFDVVFANLNLNKKRYGLFRENGAKSQTAKCSFDRIPVKRQTRKVFALPRERTCLPCRVVSQEVP